MESCRDHNVISSEPGISSERVLRDRDSTVLLLFFSQTYLAAQLIRLHWRWFYFTANTCLWIKRKKKIENKQMKFIFHHARC